MLHPEKVAYTFCGMVCTTLTHLYNSLTGYVHLPPPPPPLPPVTTVAPIKLTSLYLQGIPDEYDEADINRLFSGKHLSVSLVVCHPCHSRFCCITPDMMSCSMTCPEHVFSPDMVKLCTPFALFKSLCCPGCTLHNCCVFACSLPWRGTCTHCKRQRHRTVPRLWFCSE